MTLAFTSDPDAEGPVDNTYAIGNVVEVTATFPAAVSVAGGSPQLELDIGGTPKAADCTLATDTTKLVCAYPVAEGDEDTDGVAIAANSFSHNGAVITQGSDTVTPTHSAVAANSAHKVDGVPPKLTGAATSADGTEVVLTYDETLASNTVATTAFTVNVSTANTTSTRSVSGLATSGATVTLTLASPIKAGQAVTIDYDDPTTAHDANAVKDAPGNDTASVSAQTVTNTVAEDATVAGLTMSVSSATLTEGADPVTVTIETASGATFATDRSIALAWDGEALASNAGLVREPSGRSAVVLAAGEASGTATLVGVERSAYTVSVIHALTATIGETQVATMDPHLRRQRRGPRGDHHRDPREAHRRRGHHRHRDALTRLRRHRHRGRAHHDRHRERRRHDPARDPGLRRGRDEPGGDALDQRRHDDRQRRPGELHALDPGRERRPYAWNALDRIGDGVRRHDGVGRHHDLGQPRDGGRGRGRNDADRDGNGEPGGPDDGDRDSDLRHGEHRDGNDRLHRYKRKPSPSPRTHAPAPRRSP